MRRSHPDAALGTLTLRDVVNHYADIVADLPEKPVLVGHSMGGLVVQILLQRNLAAAGVAIDPGPPAGVFSTQWSFLKCNWPMINPLVSQFQPRAMSFADLQFAFVNGWPLAEQHAIYERYVVPESRRVPRESLGGIARLDFSAVRAPLLLTAGAADHIIPPALNRANHLRYSKSPSVSDFKEFSGRTHFVIGHPGWEEVADYALAWLAALPER